ncbi:GCN5-related protein N-acetyltransferase [Beutenbergia cavernae DSM 12333]|uniref:GCN5-related protein N-acetyltransferase n=1 Tax=Beutenbergia cavernae (strain ATCC BAA-8 / DSM 12333 / CCUG 43141 / JCM 11478 / NBRC 16432 / NCIMB 13614 / HKI 0122) TaxID=471853 RepID=C5BVC5_BEUC1|nr:GNAT family N-acetyltransferase [Beutenbergia cavernae]ACQ80512.1 GCN5-related protein N-acetyltransferase [Beutenbergia cavernae DSM 12333]
MDVVVRGAGVEDAADVARIYVESWNAGFGHLLHTRTLGDDDRVRWRRALADGVVTWQVAERGGVVVGFVGTGPSRDPADGDLGELDTIAVDPGHWRSGVGSALMAAALADLRAAGYPRAVLWTVAGYERGLAFYTQAGWVLTGAVRDDGHQVALALDLAPQM